MLRSILDSRSAIRAAVLPLTMCSVFACQRSPQSNEAPAPIAGQAAATTELQFALVSPYHNPQRDRVGVGAQHKDALKEADDDMKKVLEELQALGGRPLALLPVGEARMQPTHADAVKRVLERQGKSTDPLPMASVETRMIPGGAGPIDARIYTPQIAGPRKGLPVVVYWRGGGFVVASLDTYDASARAIAKYSDAIVVSLDYRRAPEHRFPAAHEDAFAGYKWVVHHAQALGGDGKRFAVAGESAGANLAAYVSIMARDLGEQKPQHQLLVYPLAQADMHTKSYDDWAYAKPLDRASMVWFMDNYTNGPHDVKDPRLSLVDANLGGLPKTTIVLAEIDPLRTDGELLGAKLRAAGVEVKSKTYEGVTHEFFGMGAAVSDARDAEEWAGAQLKGAFQK